MAANLTIRLREERDQQAVERLKRATHQGTASGAMLRAAHDWPRLTEDLRSAKQRIAGLEAALRRVLDADNRVDAARERLVEGFESARRFLGDR